MSVTLSNTINSKDLAVVAAFCNNKNTCTPSKWPKAWEKTWKSLGVGDSFTGSKGEMFTFNVDNRQIIVVGLGEKKEYRPEVLRRAIASLYRSLKKDCLVMLDSFALTGGAPKTIPVMAEAITMASYSFDKYKQDKKEKRKKPVASLYSKMTPAEKRRLQGEIKRGVIIGESINLCRDLVNEPPNVLHSESYSKRIQTDARKIAGVRVKALGKAELKKEKMGMFLSVNAGSAYNPQLVHLTYTPPRAGKRTKHIALVGKGLTFDTGGYSLKPPGAIINMKFDMAGSATVYAAFRIAALLKLNVKVSCYLGMTDNAINEVATMPDSIVTARNGKTVEVLNTDAEGRLVLGDTMSYACDHKPDVLIDAATLTGSALVSLGHEVCALMGNDKKLMNDLKSAANKVDEYIWELPIIEEFRQDMKSPCADLKNIGSNRWGGTSKAAAFLEYFVKDGVKWAHLDIAGVAGDQTHLAYCPSKGASGIMVRTLVNYMANAK